MIEPLLPPDEPERVAALQQLRILDTPAEERFDRITRTASDLFRVPIALVSLVDSQRQWFKSRTGLDASETPRAVSFCAHAILGTGPFVVEDALADSRFADNPLVVGPPGIRFYAGMPLRSDSGRKLGTLCIIDHSARHFGAADARRLHDLAAWAERELNLAQEIDRAVAEMRETLVRLISHELRTPVTGVVGALEVLRGGGIDADNIETLVRLATDSAGRLKRVVDEIVEIAEIDAGRQDVTPRPIDLPMFMEAARDFFADTPRQAGVGIELAAPPHLIVPVAPRPLTRILRALLDNALRFSPAGATVHFAATRPHPDTVRISVTDHGPGIPAELIPRLFLPFVQGDASDSRPHEGCGISLATGRRLAIAIGGHLGYEAGPNGGSCFYLDLPLTATPGH